ncbi:MAG: signal peptidase I [Planctomycetota bacterium]|nr:signal peptidase I [Planctomycetota bacterium]
MGKTKKTAPPSPASPDAGPPGTEAGAAGKTAPAWRAGLDFVLTLGGAVLIALAVKAYAFDVYLIPSGSMETSLHGRPDGGDRIFCSKLHYRFRPLRRWEVAVFEFPYEKARLSENPEAIEQYRGQNFVKRVVGLPGESLAISRGDVWIRPLEAGTDFRRLAKPDPVQRDMWQNVYDEDFSDLAGAELEYSWKIFGEAISLERGGALRLSPEPGPVGLDYRPLVPSRAGKPELEELPGIPDRYTLEQPVQFKCRRPIAGGGTCGRLFVKTVKTQSMLARCPECAFLNDEISAIFYHRRSGLYRHPAAAGPPQGEDAAPRRADYHLVPDLRAVVDLVLERRDSVFSITMHGDAGRIRASFAGDGRVEIGLAGRPARPEARTLADLEPGRSHRLEFYLADGVARIFVDSERECALEIPAGGGDRFQPRQLPKRSGVSLAAEGGGVEIRRIRLDRDIFYYSGWERPGGERFSGMSSLGEVLVDANSFFPMGDHCPSSFDARSWGPPPLSLLRGPALLVWWPPERFHRIAGPPG